MPGPQKITFAEMRSSGVRGLLIYCSAIAAAITSPFWRTNGMMARGFQISSHGLSAQLAASGVQMCGPTSIGISRARLREAFDRAKGISQNKKAPTRPGLLMTFLLVGENQYFATTGAAPNL
jgi:hypothetical protein